MNLLTDFKEEINLCKHLLEKLKNPMSRNLILEKFNTTKDKFVKQNKSIIIVDVDDSHYIAFGSDGCHVLFNIINDYNIFLSNNLKIYDIDRQKFNDTLLLINKKYEELLDDVSMNLFKIEEWL